MSALREDAFAPFAADDQPQLIFDTYDAEHFGNGEIEYVYRGFVVRIRNDRGDIYADIGPLGGSLVFSDRLLDRMSLPRPELRTAHQVGIFVRDNLNAIRAAMSRAPTEG